MGTYKAVTLALSGLAFYVADFLLMRRFDRQRSDSGSGRSWGYTVLVVGALALLIVQPVLLPRLGLQLTGTASTITLTAGITLIVLGLALHWWARSHIGHYYVEDVLVQSDHQVIDTGPYARVRHPTFTSFFFLAGGFLLVNPSILTLLTLVYTIVDFNGAARREEELLSREVQGYTEYMGRTGRFLPPIAQTRKP